MTQRTHVPKMIDIALALCRAVPLARLIWTRLYPDNTALFVALKAAEEACGTLVEELEKIRDYGD